MLFRSDGAQTRSFCYVADLVNGLMRLMDSDDDVVGPINLGNPNEFTIAELAEIVVEMTGSRSELHYESLPTDDPRQRQPDISLAMQTLEWQPTTELRNGLEATIDYFRKTISA